MGHASDRSALSPRPAGGLGWPLAILLCIGGLALTLALGRWLHRPDWHTAAKMVVETSLDKKARVGLTREVLRGAERSLGSDPAAFAWAVAAALSLDDGGALQRLADHAEIADPWTDAFAAEVIRSLEHASTSGEPSKVETGLALGQAPVGLVFAALQAEHEGQAITARTVFRKAQSGARLWALSQTIQFAKVGIARATRRAGG